MRISRENIRRCLPELTAPEQAALLRRNFEHWGVTVLELLHQFSPFPGHYRNFCASIGRFHGVEHWRKASAKGKGAIFASSHLGNWEFLGSLGALNGIPITIATRNLQPPWLLKKVEEARLSVGVHAAYQPRTMPTILRALKRGHAVGFVIDQYMAPPAGLKARFFGVDVDTLSAVGPLAQRTGAPVICVSSVRDEDGFIHVRLEPELDFGEAAGDEAKTTQILASKVEAWIRAHPEQWTWGHQRFKNVVWPAERGK